MTRAIHFTVMGNPVPQPRMRMTRAGHRYTPDNGVKAFKQAIAIMARVAAQRAGWKTSEAPHWITIECVFCRPSSHTTKAGKPSSKWRAFPPKATSGDGDNLEKAVWDAITASCAVWHDDDQLVQWGGIKRYVKPGEQPHTRVSIARMKQ
jgi:Holliday junction resolvase RusA-like endonuclease